MTLVSGRRLGAVSGVLLVPAWFLTAAHTPGELVGGRSAGWQAFVFAISPIAGNDMDASLALRIWMVASALSNVLLIASVVLVFWRPQAVSRTLAGSLAVATLINAYWLLLPDVRNDLRVGYYLWLAAFGVGTLAARATVGERPVAASVGPSVA